MSLQRSRLPMGGVICLTQPMSFFQLLVVNLNVLLILGKEFSVLFDIIPGTDCAHVTYFHTFSLCKICITPVSLSSQKHISALLLLYTMNYTLNVSTGCKTTRKGYMLCSGMNPLFCKVSFAFGNK